MKEWLNGDGNNRWITLKPDKDGYWITLGYRDLVVSFDSGETRNWQKSQGKRNV